MRTFLPILLILTVATVAVAQPTSASQTVFISIQTPVSMASTTPTVGIELTENGHQRLGRAEDFMAIRSHTGGRKVSAMLTTALPAGSRLMVRFSDDRRTPDAEIELSAKRPVELATLGRTPQATLRHVEYLITSDASQHELAAENRAIVFTLTD